MNDNNKEQQSLQLELPQDVAQGEYANFAIIAHSSSDFIIDQSMPSGCLLPFRRTSYATRRSMDQSAFPVSKSPSFPLTSQKVRLDTFQQ